MIFSRTKQGIAFVRNFIVVLILLTIDAFMILLSELISGEERSALIYFC